MLQTQRSRRWARAAEATLRNRNGQRGDRDRGERAAVSTPTPVNAASAQAPSTALFLLLAGLGTVALAALRGGDLAGAPTQGR